MEETQQSIVLGGGCFWCIEAIYKRIAGVKSVEPGYAGGEMENPTYNQICTGKTGHAEVVKIDFDPNTLSLKDILEIFFKIHDPTTPNRQGNDIGPQYRSIILYADDAQKSCAQQALDDLSLSKIYRRSLVTELKALDVFWPAEAYHRDYFDNNRSQPYCQMLIEPKLVKHKLL